MSIPVVERTYIECKTTHLVITTKLAPINFYGIFKFEHRSLVRFLNEIN